MKTKLPSVVAVSGLALALLLGGCGGQSRGNADAIENRAATPAEGGATSTAGSAGQSKNFGDTRAKAQQDGQSPSASPTGVSTDTPETPPRPNENPSQQQGTDSRADGAK
jgi:hypothetical protein